MKRIFLLAFLMMVLLAAQSQASDSEQGFRAEPTTGMEFVWVPGGCYLMGNNSIGLGWEKRPHEVCVDGFWMGKYEVTQAEWRSVMGSNLSMFKGDRNPVENVSWDDVQEFIRELNARGNGTFRLPTEAEWEYAALSCGQNDKFAGGQDADSVAWYLDNSDKRTHPVGGKTPNRLGLYDMTGNVEEWCQDWFHQDYYDVSPRDNPQGPIFGSYRVTRGGHFRDFNTDLLCTHRYTHMPSIRFETIGFRLVRTR